MLASALFGCASSSETDGAAAIDRAEECIRVRTVRSYDTLDDQHVWVDSGQRAFLVTLWSRCPEMRYAQAIAFTASMNACPNSPGSISFSDGGRTQRCQIRYIERVGSKGEAEAIIDDRRRFGDQEDL